MPRFREAKSVIRLWASITTSGSGGKGEARAHFEKHILESIEKAKPKAIIAKVPYG